MFVLEIFLKVAMAKKTKDLEAEMESMAPVEVETPSPSTVSVTETETTVTPMPSRAREYLQKKYPERTWETDEQFDEDVVRELETADTRLSDYADADERINRILDLNPEFVLVLDAMDKGMPFIVALRKYAGEVFDSLPEEGDPDWDAYSKAADDYLANKKKTDEEIATRNSNLEKSDAEFTKFVEANVPDEKQDAFVEFVKDNLKALSMGTVSELFMQSMLDAFNHDEDIEDAKEAGAIEARNEKITAKRIKEATETDGMPMGGGSSPIVEEEEPEDDSFLGSVLRDYERRRR